MKRMFSLIALGVVVCLTLAACDTKSCYCYNYLSNEAMPRETEEYTTTDQSCYVLNRGTAGNSGSRVCVERNERMDPSTLVYK